MTICINKISFLSVQVHKHCRLLALVYSDQKRSHQNGSRVLIFKKKLCKDIFHLEMCQKNLAVPRQDFLRSDEDRWEWPGGGGGVSYTCSEMKRKKEPSTVFFLTLEIWGKE